MSIRLHKRCLNCEAWYIVPVYSRRANSKYCSLSCTTTYRNKTNNPAKLPEVAEKIRLSRLGKPSYKRTNKTIAKMRDSISGPRHWNWQGGKTKESIKLRNSWEYKQWRTAVYQRDNYTCTTCGKKHCYLNADHIKTWAHYPELRFNVNNGRTLCVDCHYKTDTFGWKGIATPMTS